MDSYSISTYGGQLPAGLTVSPYVQYLLTPSAPHVVWWLAVHVPSGAAIGGLRMSLHGGPTGRDILGESVAVDDLSVDPSHQRVGVGAALLRASEAWLERRPDLPQTVGLGVEVDNRVAIALYLKLGYTVAARSGVPIVFAGSNGKACNVMFKRLTARQAAAGSATAGEP